MQALPGWCRYIARVRMHHPVLPVAAVYALFGFGIWSAGPVASLLLALVLLILTGAWYVLPDVAWTKSSSEEYFTLAGSPGRPELARPPARELFDEHLRRLRAELIAVEWSRGSTVVFYLMRMGDTLVYYR